MSFHVRDAADHELAGSCDLVTIFESLHDMSYPVEVLPIENDFYRFYWLLP